MEKKLRAVFNKSNKISLDEAVFLIYSFLKEDNLYKIAIQEAIGGTVYKSAIKNDAGLIYVGTMGWYCRNLDGLKKYPKLFMAFEDSTYDVGNVPLEPSSGSLFYPAKTFKYCKKVNESDVLEMLKTDCFKLENDLTIPKSDLLKLINKLPSDSSTDLYNKYQCSFFENGGITNDDMEKFLETPNLVAVRYYFGYDPSYSHSRSNRIRIILIGVDSSGKNIIPEGDITTITSQIVQNSWPPPPPPNM